MKYNILYVTSSNEKMFNFSGTKLINSFVKKNKDKSNLLFCTENFDVENKGSYPLVMFEDIGNYPFLNEWLKNNKDVIPKELGGDYDHTRDKNAKEKHLVPGSLNYKASLWFRKVASLHYAYNKYIKTKKYDALVWVDCDCIFINEFTNEWILRLFGNYDGFIMMGQRRQESNIGVESGLWGMRNNFAFFEDLFRAYKTKRYKRSLYWGDGHVMGYLLRRQIYLDKYRIVDLAANMKSSRVMDAIDAVKNVIFHAKGQHFSNNIDYDKDLNKMNPRKRAKHRAMERKVSKMLRGDNMNEDEAIERDLRDGVIEKKKVRLNRTLLKKRFGLLSLEDE